MPNFVSRQGFVVLLLVVGIFDGALCRAQEHDDRSFSIGRVNAKYQEWLNATTVRLVEYNRARKPLLQSSLAGVSCRDTEKKKWTKLPMEITYPESSAVWPSVVLECRVRRGRIENFTIHFDIGTAIDSFEVEGRSVLNADVLTTPAGRLMQLGPKGEMKFYRRVEGNAEDFKPHRVRGKRYYSYMIDAVHSPGVSTAGYRTILNSRYEPIETTDFLTDLHEFEYLGRNHYRYVSYDIKDRADGSCFIEQSVVEQKDGHVLHRFDVSQYLSSGFSLGGDRTVEFRGRSCDEIAHINSVQKLDERTWLISLGRGVVIAWDYLKNNVEWVFGRFGGQFNLSPTEVLRQAHTPRFFKNSGRLVVFENGEVPGDVKILDFMLNIATRQVVSSKTLLVTGLQSSHSGSVETRGAVYSIGAGSREKGDWDFLEYVGSRRTFAIRFSNKERSYRVYRSL